MRKFLPSISPRQSRSSHGNGRNEPPGAVGAAARSAIKWRDGEVRSEQDFLAVEEPLEIRLGGRRFTVTMRTPGHDEELAAGFLLAEGFVKSARDLGEIRRVKDRRGAAEPNIIDVLLAVPADELRLRLKRNFVVSSSCGLCGKTTIDSIRRRIARLRRGPQVSLTVVRELAPRLARAQEIFAATGGLHAAALFDCRGRMASIREDVGRHNAVDKVVGRALLDDHLPLANSILVVSGRAGYEIVQKSMCAGIPVLAAVGAPSSLAVALAREFNQTLVGFLRGDHFNVYSAPERLGGNSR